MYCEVIISFIEFVDIVLQINYRNKQQANEIYTLYVNRTIKKSTMNLPVK